LLGKLPDCLKVSFRIPEVALYLIEIK
jgi:hypothetical protein